MTAGVYRIRNQITGEVYIGSSARIEVRMKAHVYGMKSGRHENTHMSRAWATFGENAFVFEVLEQTNTDDAVLLAAEDRWMQDAKATATGLYNRRGTHVGRSYRVYSRRAEERYRELRAEDARIKRGTR